MGFNCQGDLKLTASSLELLISSVMPKGEKEEKESQVNFLPVRDY